MLVILEGEYYGKAMPKLADKLKMLGRELGIHVLERDSVEIDGVRFLGATLWTDFMLSPNRRGYPDEPAPGFRPGLVVEV